MATPRGPHTYVFLISVTLDIGQAGHTRYSGGGDPGRRLHQEPGRPLAVRQSGTRGPAIAADRHYVAAGPTWSTVPSTRRIVNTVSTTVVVAAMALKTGPLTWRPITRRL